MGMPPKIPLGFLFKSRNVLSKASSTCMLIMVASSIIMIEAEVISAVRRLPLLMLHSESSWIFIGTLNWACRVFPPFNSREALAVDAQTREILPWKQKEDSTVLSR